VIAPVLNIVDAISCMERMGPRGGDQVRLNLLLAGADAAAVDVVAAQVMGYTMEEVKHLGHVLAHRGLDPANVVVRGESVASVAYPFKKAAVAQLVPECFSVRDGGACSACMNAFLLSCQFLQQHPDRRVDVYLGEQAAKADGTTPSVAFGNCCPKGLDAEVRLRGCPPYPFALGEALKEAGWTE
jgi:hypothetical protein